MPQLYATSSLFLVFHFYRTVPWRYLLKSFLGKLKQWLYWIIPSMNTFSTYLNLPQVVLLVICSFHHVDFAYIFICSKYFDSFCAIIKSLACSLSNIWSFPHVKLTFQFYCFLLNLSQTYKSYGCMVPTAYLVSALAVSRSPIWYQEPTSYTFACRITHRGVLFTPSLLAVFLSSN